MKSSVRGKAHRSPDFTPTKGHLQAMSCRLRGVSVGSGNPGKNCGLVSFFAAPASLPETKAGSCLIAQ
jgi:hypothetical protein